jgi:hypothetical protein
LELLWPQWFALRVRADAGIDEARVEPLCLVGSLQRDGVRLHPARVEVGGEAADGDDERVVAEFLCRRDLPALLVQHRG